MIRAEEMIGTLMKRLPRDAEGLLITENVLEGTVERRNGEGHFDKVKIPEWLKEQHIDHPGRLWWLCMQLKYVFTLTTKLV